MRVIPDCPWWFVAGDVSIRLTWDDADALCPLCGGTADACEGHDHSTHLLTAMQGWTEPFIEQQAYRLAMSAILRSLPYAAMNECDWTTDCLDMVLLTANISTALDWQCWATGERR